MNEEPRVHDALERLMEMLDTELLTALIRNSGRQLNAPVVAEASESLQPPDREILQEARAKAREKVRGALLEWLEATDDWMHFPEEPGQN